MPKKKPRSFPCGTCKKLKANTCREACKRLNSYLKDIESYQRELPIPHIMGQEDYNKNLMLDLLDFSRHHVVEDKYGELRAPTPFTLIDLESI